MSNPKAILRIQKLKAPQLPGASAHVAREKNTPNADPSVNNEVLVGSPRAKDDIDELCQKIEDQRSELGMRSLPSNGVKAVEFFLGASPEFFEEATHEEVREWADASVQFLQDKYGEENIVHATLHLDEKTPHVHAYHVPATQDPSGRPTISAKQFYGPKGKLNELQDEYPAHMQEKDFDLDRGLRGSKANHKKIQHIYTDINRADPPDPPKIKVETPPLNPSQQKRETWAKQQTQKIQKQIKKLSRLIEHWKSKAIFFRNRAIAAEDRVEQYQKLNRSPKALQQAIRDARETPALRTELAQLKQDNESLRADKALLDRLEEAGVGRQALKQQATIDRITEVIAPGNPGEPDQPRPNGRDRKPGQEDGLDFS